MSEVFVPGAGRGVLLDGSGPSGNQASAPRLATGLELRAVDVQGVPGIMFVFNRGGHPYPPMILAMAPELLEKVPEHLWDLLDRLLPGYREEAGEAPGA